ncbi:hypothetical protein B0A55_10591 [Friedmanniomyces simplex]|uniref:NAD(P)-binding domain-containing protein n=1 Tax=Friedmanniomyces simplex TaxID=329884 RepID=A0A4U0WD70_9PEZI|nr:hypothetical protein B0A55_10591 [Friedmanniomyces simplex]
MPNVLVIGATRGLGYQLAKQYAQREHSVTGTARSAKPKDAHHDIHWVTGVDVANEDAGKKIAEGLKGHKQDLVIITAGYFGKDSGSKIIIVSSESGSISLRHESEGGGMYGHHASKAASNMVGKLLSLDLKDKGIAVGIVHPGFMRTEMTKSVGFDQFWDAGGAVTPEVAAQSLIKWIEEDFDMSKTGQYWAPRGPADIGTAEPVLGAKESLSTPLQLPW